MTLQELLEGLLVKYLCQTYGIQNCHCCRDFNCGDNLSGGMRAWYRAMTRRTSDRTSLG
jgi:hypothetical protein